MSTCQVIGNPKPMISGDRWGLSFPDICLTLQEKPQKKPQPGKLTRPGIELGQWCYPLTKNTGTHSTRGWLSPITNFSMKMCRIFCRDMYIHKHKINGYRKVFLFSRKLDTGTLHFPHNDVKSELISIGTISIAAVSNFENEDSIKIFINTK